MMNTKRRKAKKINYVGYLFIFPSMFFFCLYILYPVFFVVKNGLYEWSTLSNMKMVGLAKFFHLDYHDSSDPGNSWIFVGICN